MLLRRLLTCVDCRPHCCGAGGGGCSAHAVQWLWGAMCPPPSLVLLLQPCHSVCCSVAPLHPSHLAHSYTPHSHTPHPHSHTPHSYAPHSHSLSHPPPGLPRPRSSSQGAISPAPDEPSPYAVASAARLPSREKTPPAVAPKPTSSSQYAKVNKVAMTRKRSASPPSSPPPPPPGKSDSQCSPSLMEAD